MSGRSIVVLLLALICGAAAAFGVNQLRPGPSTSGDAIDVATASVDVPRGRLLDAKCVKISQVDKKNVPKGALKAVDDVVGRTALVPLVQGEAIVDSRLTEKDGGRGLAAMVPEGMRAFTIQVSHVATDMGGFLLPGNRVDVLLTTSSSGPDETTGGSVTTTLLQNVQVLAVAQELDAPGKNKMDHSDVKCVTVLVTPDQAAKLDLGMNKGMLHVTLRNPGDEREAHISPATMADLRFHQEKPVALADFWRGLAGAADRAATVVAALHSTDVDKSAVAQGGSPPEAAVAQESKQAAMFSEIRTLRGSDTGVVRVQLLR